MKRVIRSTAAMAVLVFPSLGWAAHFGDQVVNCVLQKDEKRADAEKAFKKYGPECEKEVQAARDAGDTKFDGPYVTSDEDMRQILNGSFPNRAAQRTPTDDSMLRTARKSVSRRMKDPAATRFRNLRVIQYSPDAKAVCGEFNSKNSYGAYVGFSPFVFGLPDEFAFESNPDKAIYFLQVTKKYCGWSVPD